MISFRSFLRRCTPLPSLSSRACLFHSSRLVSAQQAVDPSTFDPRFVHIADQRKLRFPNESEGNNYDFNWSLASDDIVPYNNAYLNLPRARLDALVKESDAMEGQTFPWEELSPATFVPLHQEITRDLSNASSLYCYDGAIGSFRSHSKRIRVISDSPQGNLLADLVLHPVSIKNPDATRDIIVYIATKHLTIPPNGVYANVEVEQDEDESPSQEEQKKQLRVVLSGLPTPKNLLDGWTQLYTQLYPEELVLECDVVRQKSRTALVFNASEQARDIGMKHKQLYCGHAVCWTEQGLSALFHGVMNANGQIVPNPCDNLAYAPSMIFFKGNTTKPLTSEEIMEQYRQVYTNSKESNETEEINEHSVKKLQQMVEKHNVKGYVIQSDEEIIKLMKKEE